jgi:hypothetical protein
VLYLPIPATTHAQQIERATTDAITILRSIPEIHSSNDVARIREALKFVILPGPVTAERLRRVDGSLFDWRRFASQEYACILELLLDKFDAQFPGRNGSEIAHIFKVDDCFEFAAESLQQLTAQPKRLKVGASILEEVVSDETVIFAALVDLSWISPSSDHLVDIKIGNFVQLLCNLPNTVGNALKMAIPDLFLPDAYSHLLLVHFLKACYFVVESNVRQNVDLFGWRCLGQLLSKIALNFNFQKAPNSALVDALTVLETWAQTAVKAKQIQQLFGNLTRSAIEIVAVLILRKEGGGYCLQQMLGTNILADWKYVLTTKIPLLTFYSVDHDLIARNLIVFWHSVSEGRSENMQLFITLIKELLNSWSSRQSIRNTSLEQHIYVTKLVLLAISTSNSALSNAQKSEFKRKIYDGVQPHIESSNKRLRCIGMITAELILALLEPIESVEDRLTFDYLDFDVDTQKFVGYLRTFAGKCKYY